jgi:hypothetical protein
MQHYGGDENIHFQDGMRLARFSNARDQPIPRLASAEAFFIRRR